MFSSATEFGAGVGTQLINGLQPFGSEPPIPLAAVNVGLGRVVAVAAGRGVDVAVGSGVGVAVGCGVDVGSGVSVGASTGEGVAVTPVFTTATVAGVTSSVVAMSLGKAGCTPVQAESARARTTRTKRIGVRMH